MDGRRAGVPRRRAEHIERLAAHPALPLIEVAKQLQREILEGERRPVKQLEHKQILAELFQRRHGRMGKTPVGAHDDVFELRGFNVGREPLEKLNAQVGVAEVLHAPSSPDRSGRLSGRKSPPSGASPTATASEKPSGSVCPRVEMKRIVEVRSGSREKGFWMAGAGILSPASFHPDSL